MSRAASSPRWYTEGLEFTCTHCGDCCGGAPGYVWVSPVENRAIARHLGMSAEEFEQTHTRRVGRRRSLLELPDGDCEFLVRQADGRTLCAIHPARPVQCRTWPFWKSNLTSARAWDRSAASCPGMNRGKHHSFEVIQAALWRNAKADLPL